MTKPNPEAQVRLSMLAEFSDRVMRVHNLVEQWATNRAHSDELLIPIARAFGRLKIEFTGAGFDALANLSGSMEISSRRGFGRQMKVRILRESVGSMRLQLDVEQRAVLSALKEAAKKEAEAAEEEQV